MIEFESNFVETKEYLTVLRRAADYIGGRSSGIKPSAAIILGSGLGTAVPALSNKRIIPFSAIPGFPKTTVEGHEGKLILGSIGKKGIAVLQGRFHYYEGHSMGDVTLPVRVLAALGIKNLIVTAAVGSMNLTMKPGDIVLINDHINLMGANPLRGLHQKPFGTMFPDLIDAYDPLWRKAARSICKRLGIACREGVYTAVAGPSYETPAEIRAFRRLGGDVVGMSMVPEVIVARQNGVRVLAMSWVANMAAGLTRTALTHAEVLELGTMMAVKLRKTLDAILRSTV